MTTILIAFLVAFAVAVVATRLVMIVAWKIGAVDAPDGYRKIHKHATPRLGGVAVGIAVCCPFIGLLMFPEVSLVSRILQGHNQKLLGLFACGGMALAVGAVDDIFNLRARWKLLWQIVIAASAFAFGFTIRTISNPFGPPLDFGMWSLPITVFWFVGCMNAVNLLDGLDGLAAGTCLFVNLTLFLVSLQFSNVLGMLLTSAVSGAILGFLLFNFPPAKIFLGDSGSLLLGFLVAALSLVGMTRKAEAGVALFVPVVALGVPILDTSLAILRRWYKRLPISSPDRQHIHHVLVAMGYSQQRVVLTLYAISVVLGIAALVITFGRNEVVLAVMGSLIVTAFVCIRVFSGVGVADVLSKLVADRNRRVRHSLVNVAVERTLNQLPETKTMDELWSLCNHAFDGLGVDFAELYINGSSGEPARWKWARRNAIAAGGGAVIWDEWCGKMSLCHDGTPIGEFSVKYARADEHMFEVSEVIERLKTGIAFHVWRLTGPKTDVHEAGKNTSVWTKQ
jgi:UDP-GlcNAc:undecaprenyl-phosphate GlcNAc-1-phosphate transferase